MGFPRFFFNSCKLPTAFCMLVALCSMLVSTKSFAQIPAHAKIQTFEVLDKNTENITISDMIYRRDWKTIEAVPINLYLSESPHWLRLRLNGLPAPDDYLLIQNPMLYSVTFYGLYADGKYHSERYGFLEGNVNYFGSRHFVFKLGGIVDETVYLRILSRTPLQIPINVLNERSLIALSQTETAMLTAMLGIMFAFSIYNFTIFMYTRRRVYFYYAMYGSFLGAVFATTEGMMPGSLPVSIRPYLIHIFSGPAFAALIMFTIELHQTQKKLIYFTKFLYVVAATCMLIPFLSLYGDLPIWHALGAAIAGVTMVSCFVVSILNIRKQRIAQVYLTAFMMPVIGTVLYDAQLAGSIPSTLITQHAVRLGAVLEIIIFSQALGMLIDQLYRNIFENSVKLEAANHSLQQEIVERKRIAEELEEQRAIVVHTAKMRELGNITAAVAHEVNNPLAVLSMTINRLNRIFETYDPHDGRKQDVNQVVETSMRMITRITKVVRSLLSYARDSVEEPMCPVLPTQVVNDLFDICQAGLVHRQIRLEIGVMPEVPILCRSSEMTQILLNLVNNAADALANTDDGFVRITCSPEDSHVAFRVEDNGPGVPESFQPLLMQKQFTTKKKGEGTGLGLGICKMLADRNNATLAYERLENQTSFVLRVPQVNALPDEQAVNS